MNRIVNADHFKAEVWQSLGAGVWIIGIALLCFESFLQRPGIQPGMEMVVFLTPIPLSERT
jgi:hypothetical protein